MIHISIRRYVARFTSASYLPCATSCVYLKKFSAKMIYYNDYRLCLYFVHTYITDKWCLLNISNSFVHEWSSIPFLPSIFYILFVLGTRYIQITRPSRSAVGWWVYWKPENNKKKIFTCFVELLSFSLKVKDSNQIKRGYWLMVSSLMHCSSRTI